MTRTVAVMGVMLVVTGCVLGTTMESFTPAHSPAGMDVTLQVAERTYAGELLAVEDTALLLVVRFPNPDSSTVPRLARVPTRQIRDVTGLINVRERWVASDANRFRPLARYPQGVSSALEARLAEAYGVERVQWVPQ